MAPCYCRSRTSLLGIGELCDIGLHAIFDKNKVYIVDPQSQAVVLTGDRDPITKLWMIALKPITEAEEKSAVRTANSCRQQTQKITSPDSEKTQKSKQKINSVSAQNLDTAGDRVEFFSRVFCSAAESTLLNAVKKGWIKFPGITLNILKRHRHRLRTHEAAAGHLDQTHQNHAQPRRQISDATSSSSTTTQEGPEARDINILTYVHQERNHMDATGRFPATSHRGHQYILILYSEGANYIRAEPMVDRTKQSYISQSSSSGYATTGFSWISSHLPTPGQ